MDALQPDLFDKPQALPEDAPATALATIDDAAFRKAVGIKTPPPAPAEVVPPAQESATADAQESVVQEVLQEAGKKVEAQEAPKVEDEAKTEEKPKEGEEAPKPALTKFTVSDKEGELEVPELFFDFKANGKEYAKVPLEKVVLLAQMGFTNQEREAQVLASKKFVAEAQQGLQDRDSQLNAYNDYFRRIFEEPEFFEVAREEYARQNSPEQRAARAEQQLRMEQQRQQETAEQSVRAQFVQTTLLPTVTKLLDTYPGVSQEEVIGRYTMLTAPLLVRGQVPASRLPTVQHIVEYDLANWVKETHAVRELEKTRTSTEKKQLANVAKTESQLSKSRLARAVAPPAASAPASTQTKKKEYATVEEWMNTELPTVAP
jgi:hypothetical protein